MAAAERASRLLGTKLKGTHVTGARVRSPASLHGHASAGVGLQADSGASDLSDVSPAVGRLSRAVRAIARGHAGLGRGRGGGSQRRRAGRALPVKYRRHQMTWTEVTPSVLELCSTQAFANEFLTKEFKAAARHAVQTAKGHLKLRHLNRTSYSPQHCAELLLQGAFVEVSGPMCTTCRLTARVRFQTTYLPGWLRMRTLN